MSLCAELIVVHASGLRMIESGADGISRGDLKLGLMGGQSILSLIPLHLGAIEHSGSLKSWISEWAGESTEFLSPNPWPDVHWGEGT